MTQDLSYIFSWWLIVFSLGIINFPLTKGLFPRFFDFGYPFSKILGILLTSYLVWLLGSLKILPFFRETIGLVIIALALINFLIFQKNRQTNNNKQNLPKKGAAAPKRGRILIFEEVLFFLGLLFWAWVRAHEPSIHGLEKFMDYGFINSILRSKFFPPHDMWLAPSPDPRYTGSFTINYYYFGHLTAAVLTKLSGLDSAITYNLVLATLFGLCFTGSFSIGGNLLRRNSKFEARNSKQYQNSNVQMFKTFRILNFGHWNLFRISNLGFRILLGGLLTAFLVTLAGNLHTLYIFKDPTRYWYPDATRFIPFTIHEFPLYSWVVADLHGHVFDIPFVLLTIALLVSLFQRSQQSSAKSASIRCQKNSDKSDLSDLASIRRKLMSADFSGFSALLGLVLAVLYMTNAWDGIIYLGLSGLVFLVTHLKIDSKSAKVTKVQSSKFKVQSYNSKRKDKLSFKFYALVLHFALLAFSLFLFSLPFNLTFTPFVKGIGVNCPPAFAPEKLGPFLFEKGNCQRSPLWMLAILWGFFYFNATAFVIFLLGKRATGEATKFSQIASERGTKRLWKESVPSRASSGLRKFLWPTSGCDTFLLLMIFLSTLLLIFPEFFYAKDIYPAHFRANTMFKLGYQAFIMLSIASGYIIIRIINSKSKALNPKHPEVEQSSLQGSPDTELRSGSGQIPNSNAQNSKQRKFGLLGFRILKLSRLCRGSSTSSGFGISDLVFRIFLIPQLFLISIYPYYAINSYYGNFKIYHGLNGIDWLKNQYPDDYQAILWLKRYTLHATRYTPIIVEAVGESYTDYARVSANTGLPTILGWPVHQWLWRGSFDEPGKRIPEVQTIYESGDLEQTKSLLKKYSVSYIFLGTLEREKYKNLNEEKFAMIGRVVFESGRTKIYEIKN